MPGRPGYSTLRTLWPGLTRPCENQLLPARGPKKSPARTMMTLAPCVLARSSRASSSTRMAPLRVCGRCGASSASTGKASGPKLYTVPGSTMVAFSAIAAEIVLSSMGSTSWPQLR
ncbi:hypothetical protein D3C72_1250310 [compost metagenome]